MRITQKDIAKLPEGTHRADDGLYVRVRGGSTTYQFRYSFGGKRKTVSLGSAKVLTLARAKEIAFELKSDLAAGVDPADRFKKKDEPQTDDRGPLFRDIYAEAVSVTDDVRQWKNDKHRAQWTSVIVNYALPLIGDKPVKEIDRDDIIRVLKPIWMTKTATASRLRGRLERVFSYAIFKGLHAGPNPATFRGNLDMVFPSPTKIHTEKHMEAMTLDEAREVCSAFVNRGAIGNLCTVFGVLTALRAGEFTQARWEEIDFAERIYTVPPERRKVAREFPHRVPLSTQAVAILEFIREFDKDGKGFVFKAPQSPEDHLNLETPRMLLKKFFKKPVTMHGTRSTFRDWAEETGQNERAAERALMHQEPNKVTRAYQRSDLLDIRRPLMQAWADAVLPMEIVEAAIRSKKR